MGEHVEFRVDSFHRFLSYSQDIREIVLNAGRSQRIFQSSRNTVSVTRYPILDIYTDYRVGM